MPERPILLYGGTIRTMAPDADAHVEAVAIGRDGRILVAGAQSEAAAAAGPDAVHVHLEGAAAIPGFMDCHLHALHLGQMLGHADLSAAVTRDEIVASLRAHAETRPDAQVLQGARYDQNRLPGAAHITRHELDKVSTSRPIRVGHVSGHAAVVNTTALRLMGWWDAEDPPGGTVVRDNDGLPTGVLLETAAWQRVEAIVPPPSAGDIADALERAGAYLCARGITSASDAATGVDELDGFATAVRQNRARVRLTCMVSWPEIVDRTSNGAPPTPADFRMDGIDGHLLHVGQVKLFADGAITTRTCWLTEPFADGAGHCGVPIHAPEHLRYLITAAHRAGWQIATHAIGDRAIEAVLEAYAEAQRVTPRPRPDHRIEHCMLLDADLVARLRRQNVWSIGQPEFIARLGDAYISALGPERASRLSPYATLERSGVAQAFSSDCPVVPGAPLDGILAACTRTAPSGAVLAPSETLSPGQALHAYTAAPAYATRTNQDRGTLEAGKWADITILTRDPVCTPLTEWESLSVAQTWVGGEQVHVSA